MRNSESRNQLDLFAPADERQPLFDYAWPDEILAFRRPELQKMLKMVQDAKEFPWPNLTFATTEEMRFNGMARLLPPAEGLAMLEAFAREIRRVYELIEEPWEPLYHAVLRKLYICPDEIQNQADSQPEQDERQLTDN